MHRAIQRGRRRFGGQGGFTLFEVIMVLLILGVISYFATTRIFTDDGITRVSEVDLIKNHLRYAQSRAMNSDMNWGIRFAAPNQYWLFKGDDPVAGKQRLPNVEDLVARIPGAPTDGSMTLSTVTVPDLDVKFDAFGSPGNTTIVIATPAENITVTRNTGFIP